MKKLYKKTICMVLCLVMTLSFSATAFASAGKISFGNATVTWNMTSSNSTNTLSYIKTAKLKFKGSLYVKNTLSGMSAQIDFNEPYEKTNFHKLSIQPGAFSKFVSSKKNSISAYIDGNCFVTYKPQP